MAYNRNNTVAAYLSDNTVYRAWWDAIRAQFTAVGLVQTADTGQLDPATHARPSANSYSGYEIWRFADSLQATLPIFMKIEPGVGSVTDRPAIRITVATATNGAGTLSGQVGTAMVGVRTLSKSSGDTLPSFMSHGEGYFHFFTNVDVNSTNFAFGFVVERPFSNGAPTAEGIYSLLIGSSSAATTRQCIPVSGTVPSIVTASTSMPLPLINTAGLGSASGVKFVAMLGTHAFDAQQRFTCVASYNRAGDLTGDLVDLDGVSNPKVKMWGQDWKYLAIGDALTGAFFTGSANDSLMMRAE